MQAPITRGALATLSFATAALLTSACAHVDARDRGGAAAAPDAAPSAQTAAPADPLFDEPGDEAEEEIAGGGAWDPLENPNRAVYRFNQEVDHWVLQPVTRVYRLVVPDLARQCVRRALLNLNSPIYVANDLLQLRPLDALETAGAFVVNSTIGWGGLFDVGHEMGIDPKPGDFGETLALVGVGSGPYLVFPLFGPSTLRDGIGGIVDRALHPLTYILGFTTQVMWGGGIGVARYDEYGDEIQALEESSIDSYSVVRSAYLQARERAIDASRQRRLGASCGEGAP
jgi:phospholipid-binding lipoprotein MlaA